MKKITIDTPCIGICSTVYGDNVCRGCKRFSHEIIQWNQYPVEQKKRVWERLVKLQSQILGQKIKIVDVDKLEKFSLQQKLRIHQDLHPYSWAFQVLSLTSDRMVDLRDCGLMALNEYQHMDIKQLSELINEEYYQLSLAHFDISFTRHQQQVTKR